MKERVNDPGNIQNENVKIPVTLILSFFPQCFAKLKSVTEPKQLKEAIFFSRLISCLYGGTEVTCAFFLFIPFPRDNQSFSGFFFIFFL